MPHVARIIGGAGTGKTTRLLKLMVKAAQAGDYSPFEIGFVSFTRAARAEAAERAANVFGGVTPDELQQLGWFRTLHSCCFRQIGVKQESMLTNCVKDRQWLTESIGEEVSGVDSESENPFTGSTRADRALSLWGTARNKMCPLVEDWEVASYCDNRTPDYSYCVDVIEKYEQAKRLDGRYDFTDITARFAGVGFRVTGPYETRKEGEIPDVPVWFLDEQQDTSALLDLVCRRLVSNSRWVYLSLDPFQSIYGWSGASYKHAMAWEVQKEETLDQSFRCPKEISELGEQCLQRCTDYWDRGIRSASHSGEIEQVAYESPWPSLIKGNESWLLIARTNHCAQRLAKRLESYQWPWLPTNGGGNIWSAPVRKKIIEAMLSLQWGGAVTLTQWKQVAKEVKGGNLIRRGMKKTLESMEDVGELRFAGQLDEWGATAELIKLIETGEWYSLVERASEWISAIERHGLSSVFEPQIRIGTIHSVKGSEADNVVLFRSTSEQVNRGMAIEEIANEEHRLAYVGVTRTRKRLIILNERDCRFNMEIL